MALNDKLFVAKQITCPVCEKQFTRYILRKTQFSVAKRDSDYRPIYIGHINPRLYAICVCPHCFYAGEDKFFCPRMSEDDLRSKEYFQTHKAEWEAQNRILAVSSGRQIWKDLAAEKLKGMSPDELLILRRISPLLQKVATNIAAKSKPYNELQRDGDLDAAIRSYELAAICYKARRANHRILGYTYLHGAWTARDAAESSTEEANKKVYNDFETAYLREAVNFLTITNKATSLEDHYLPDGTCIPKENLPESRIFEITYILAGAYRRLGDIETSNKFLEQILYGVSGAQGIILWFVNQAKEMRQSEKRLSQATGPIPDEPSESDNM